MANATLAAHKTLVVMGRETTYGTAFVTPTVKLPDMFDYSFGKEQVQVPQKTQTIAPMIQTSQLGRLKPTVTLKGAFSDTHEEMWVALFGDSANPYTIAADDIAANAAGYSYTIASLVPTASDAIGVGVVATGCRLVTFTLAPEGGVIMYTAVFDAKSIDDQSAAHSWVLTGITDTSAPVIVPFMLKSVTASLLDTVAVTALTNFSLTITNEYASDDICFQNAATRISQPKCGTTGVLTAEFLYGTENDATIYDNLLGQTPYTDNIILTDGTNIHTIATEGQYIDYSRPDKDKCLFLTSFTKELKGTSAVVPITVTTS